MKAAGERYRDGKAARIDAIRLGRENRVTWEVIGAALGISGATCRQLWNRAESGK